MRAIILLLSAALCCGSANALVPHEINYQGYLTSPGGTPVNASVSMVLSLYNVPAGGTALYAETQTVTVTNGVFNVLIGSVAALPLPFDVPYYLGVKVGSDAEMAPRQQVAASAYAIRAANAEALAASATVAGSQITGALSSATLPATALTGTITGGQLASSLTLAGTTAGTFSGPLTGNVTGNLSGSAGSATNFTGTLAGNVTGTQGATTIAASTVTGKALTGFSSGAGTITATDTLLTAINKLDGNIALKAPLASTGAAQFVRTIQSPNNSVPPGTAFTIDTQVFNSVPTAIIASSGNGGTVFTLNTTGTYVLDYEMSLGSAGSVGLYTGPSAGTVVLDNNTIAGASTATTWIHGRALVVVAGSPVVVEVSSVAGTASVVTAGSAAGTYMIRLTILKIA